MSDDIDKMFSQLEKEAKEIDLPETIDDLQKKVIELRKTLELYGITEELHITNVEYICQKGLDDLKKTSMNGMFTPDDAKVLDILHKNLRMARGNMVKKEAPGRMASEAELLKIVKNDEAK